MAILDLTKILNLALRARFNILVRSNMAYINLGLSTMKPISEGADSMTLEFSTLKSLKILCFLNTK